MNLLTKEELRALMEKPEGWCVSLYMPTHRAYPENKQDPIRFKNLLRKAEERLKAAGLRSPEAKEFLKPARPLLKDTLFWQFQSDGFAAFLHAGGGSHYRLPLKCEELAVVADRFHIKPLLPLFADAGHFFLLALSQNEVRLFHCSRFSASELEMEGVPKSLDEALRYDEPEKQLQFHTRAPAAGGTRAALFHGHGGGTEEAKKNILRYFQLVDQGLRRILREEQAPLVLAGVDYLFPIYREANRYPHLADAGIPGNPEGGKTEELHGQAWKIVEPLFLKAQKAALAQYEQREGTGRTSQDLGAIISAAFEGRIDTLFVAEGIQQWGVYDPRLRTVHLHAEALPGDEDLLDLAAVHTFLNRGTVYPLKPQEVPGGGVAAVIFRY
jgi:hypothetical protein